MYRSRILLCTYLYMYLSVATVSALEMAVVARLEGKANGDWFGTHVANLGDINNDGYQDFGIGSVEGNGRVYVYLGSPTFDTVPDLTIAGDSVNGLDTGYSFETTGDLNKDGYDDFMVGYLSQIQRIYHIKVFLGSNTPDAVPDYQIVDTVDHTSSSFGVFLASGDLDSNGYPDIAATSFSFLSGDRIEVFLQDSVFNPSPSFTFTDSVVQFGYYGMRIADINGDGYADLLTSSENAGSSGSSYLYFGRDILVNVPDLIFPRDGYHAAGDINADSVSDFGISLGQFAFYFGGAFLDTVPDYSIGASAVGKIDGDQYGDIVLSGDILGAAGIVRVYLGGNPMDSFSDWDSTFPCAPFQGAVTVDINGDGKYEVISPSRSYPCDDFRGLVYIFSSDTTTDVSDKPPGTLPKNFELYQNFPNPFNSSTVISYALERSSLVTLQIYDIQGKLVTTLVEEAQRVGIHQVTWDGTDYRGEQVASGIYFYRLKTENSEGAGKAVLIR